MHLPGRPTELCTKYFSLKYVGNLIFLRVYKQCVLFMASQNTCRLGEVYGKPFQAYEAKLHASFPSNLNLQRALLPRFCSLSLFATNEQLRAHRCNISGRCMNKAMDEAVPEQPIAAPVCAPPAQLDPRSETAPRRGPA